MEAAILRFFESIRCPFLSGFFGIFSLLGEATVVGGVAILVFWLAPKRAGEQIIMTALTSFPLNSALKALVARPRPYVAGVVAYEKPFFADGLDPYASFPSGHTQSSSSLFFSAADATRKRRLLIAAGVLSVLVMLARMYFGAHYPTDVLTGLALGILVTVLWAAVFRRFYDLRHLILLFFAAASLAIAYALPSHDMLQAAGLISGAAIALALSPYVIGERKTTFLRRLPRLPVGIAVCALAFVFTIFFPEGAAFTLLKWFLIALSAGLIAPLLFDLIGI